jgi:uncharacterized lipoprotein YmbA
MSRSCGLRAYLLGGLVVLTGLAGCAGNQTTSFYTLSSTSESQPSARSGEGLVIGLGPVTLPQYLDRPDIVTRAGANQMRLGEVQKWAEPLEPMLTRVMSEDLYALLDAKDVIPLPQRGDLPLARVVEVDISRFDANETGEIKLDARWRIYRGNGSTLVTSGRSLLTEQGAAGPDYDAIVAAMSRALGKLSAEIAGAMDPPVSRKPGAANMQ